MKLRIDFSKEHNDYVSDKTMMNSVSSKSEKETCFPSVDIRSKSIAYRTFKSRYSVFKGGYYC